MPSNPNLAQRVAQLVTAYNERAATRSADHAPPGVQRGHIYVAHPDPADPATPNKYVLVIRVVPSGNYAVVLPLGNLPSFATDHDLILQPDDTALGFESVIYANLRAPLWITQLGEHRGQVSDNILQLLPDVSIGAADDANHYRIGLPLQNRDDPRRQHKKDELAELQRLGASCINALLDDGDFWGHTRLDETGSQLLELVLDTGARSIVTFEHVFEAGDAPAAPLSPLPDNAAGVLDPGALTTTPPDSTYINRIIEFLLEHPNVAPPLLTPELLDRFNETINTNFPEQAQLLRRALLSSGINANSCLDIWHRIRTTTESETPEASDQSPEYLLAAV